MTKLLAIGPDGNPITGQYVSFKNYVQNSRFFPTSLFYKSGHGIKFKYIWNVFFIFKLLYILFKVRPNAIYFTSSRSFQGFLRDIFIVSLGKLFRAKVVNHLHGADFKLFYNNSNRNVQYMIDWVYRKIDISIVLSDSMHEQYSRYQSSMIIKSVANAYGQLKFTDVNDDNQENLKLVYLSNLMRSKGILELLEALKLVKEQNINVELKVAGSFLSDHLMSSRQLEAEFVNLNYGICEYLGSVQGSEKNALLNWADCLILPTYYPTEAQPICIIEGMASGCVIISTKHNYIADLVKPENGVLVKSKSITELALAISNVASDRSYIDKVKQFNKQFASITFSLDRYVNQIDNIINELLVTNKKK